MAALTQELMDAWEARKGPAVFTTVAEDGTPNSVWVGALKVPSPEMMIVVDNYFDKTRANIMAGSKGSMLWITDKGKSYQVKGTLEYHTEGPIFDAMRQWAGTKHPRVAAVVLIPDEAYSGSTKLL